MKRKASSSDSNPTSKDKSSSSSKKLTKVVVKPSSSSSDVRAYFYTDIKKYNSIIPLGFLPTACQEVSRVDDIVLYRQGNVFHAISAVDQSVISRNITFDHINQVNHLLLVYLVY
jgi:hypothetical protein